MNNDDEQGHDDLEILDRRLEAALTALEQCARILSKLSFSDDRGSVKAIGRAMSEIGGIRTQIWERRPDLRPEYTRKDWGKSASGR